MRSTSFSTIACAWWWRREAEGCRDNARGAAKARSKVALCTSPHNHRHANMPRLATGPTTVVETPDVKIDEYFGNASCNPCPGDISFAHVKAQGGWAEEWQTPAFDEYTLILKGSVTIEYAHGPPLTAKAGQAIFLAKGERVRWALRRRPTRPDLPPGVSPANCFREEGIPPAEHDKTRISTTSSRRRYGRRARPTARPTIRQHMRRTASPTRRPTHPS